MSEKNNDVFTAISIVTLGLVIAGIGLCVVFKQSYTNPNYTPPVLPPHETKAPQLIESEEGAAVDKPEGEGGEVKPIEPIADPAAPAGDKPAGDKPADPAPVEPAKPVDF